MENTFVKILREHRSEVSDALREADLMAAEDAESRYLVYAFDDGSARTLRIPAAEEAPDLDDLPCVLVGSFCYADAAPEQRAAVAGTRDYDAIVENCIVILHHYR